MRRTWQDRQSELAKMRADLAASHALRERNIWQAELQIERERADKYGAMLERAMEQVRPLAPILMYRIALRI